MKIPPNKSEYPQRISINKVEYTIVFVDQIEGSDTLGLCDFERKVIFLKNKQSPKERFLTFIHEVLHAIEYEFNAGVEHELVYKLEVGIAETLIQVLKDQIFK